MVHTTVLLRIVLRHFSISQFLYCRVKTSSAPHVRNLHGALYSIVRLFSCCRPVMPLVGASGISCAAANPTLKTDGARDLCSSLSVPLSQLALQYTGAISEASTLAAVDPYRALNTIRRPSVQNRERRSSGSSGYPSQI
jgi:hypothetical protein